MPRWLKVILYVIGSLILLFIIAIVGASIYISYNKAKVLKMVNEQLDKSVDGTLVIGDMKPNFFKGFPDVSLGLANVTVRDKKYDQHKHTLLDAKNLDVSINTMALFRGTIDVNHITISNAAIDLFTDSTGYSNTAVFKKDNKQVKDNPSESSSATQLKKFTLRDVSFTVDNQQANKLFKFDVNGLNGNMAYPDTGWRASFHLDVMAKSMAFNTKRGSFIKNKKLDGDFVAGYNEDNGRISIQAKPLNIGGDGFNVNAVFNTSKKPSEFSIHLANDKLLWRHASALLAKNITQVLNQYDLKNPIAVTANISGSFGGGEPLLYVTAKTNGNLLTTPGVEITDCNFSAFFSNHFEKGREAGDENSVIQFTNLSGQYNHLPFKSDTVSIVNLAKPVATGNFKSSFPSADINYFFDDNVAKFANGWVDMNLRYRANVIDYKFNKPFVQGAINFRNTDINYFPRNLLLKKTSMSLNFVKEDLIIKNVHLQSGKSIVDMEGRINNFLNLYYTSPEKALLTWQIRSPQLYLNEFLGFLGAAKGAPPKRAPSKQSSNVIDQLATVLELGQAQVHMQVDRLSYKKFLATQTRADLLTTPDGIIIKNAGLKTSGGTMSMSGKLTQGKVNKFALNTTISHVNTREFFAAFNNFGMTDFTSDNFRGILSAKTNITGLVTDAAALVPKSIYGTLDLNLQDVALIDFKPITGIGKFAFPFRDVKHITIPVLDAHFNVQGDKVIVKPMQLNSSVLNMDLEGVYGFDRGTDIAVDIPLRNPKNDSEIADPVEREKKRMKGIVLHIRAHEEEGKLKFGWNKNHK
ncbi:AsmA family protein [Mucilaginibacter pallidiroseus]|uniref:AsmA family protein n=1 Tax=Mucilaginibacter pallidiroseus TaxID=2599295 RepID=A0A563UCX3_9SPHI|nr:AsmA family protein [Mucilaginibacter pallidiroseus]TWR29205.1 AsmA family protein [Mucilaginibacter pallidiroseus]